MEGNLGVNSIPLISSLFINCLLKCNPAVGAATAPSFLAKIVWYLSLSSGIGSSFDVLWKMEFDLTL